MKLLEIKINLKKLSQFFKEPNFDGFLSEEIHANKNHN